MSIKDKIFNRYNAILLILVLMITALVFRLATLTIAQGDYYRDLSDNKRIREVYTTAPRGDIRDRHGRLIAGTVPSFTVQLLKDEVNIKNRELRNENILKLIRLLEEDGTNYSKDYPIELNRLVYKDISSIISHESSPTDRIIDIIIENNLLSEILEQSIAFPYNDHFKYDLYKKLEYALNERREVEQIDISVLDEQALNKLLLETNYDKNIIRKLFDHPISRELIYKTIERNGLNEDIRLEQFTISFYEDYINQKAALMKLYPFISEKSSAKEDFIGVFKEVSLKSFLNKIIKVEGEESFVPGKYLLSLLEEKGVKALFAIELNEDENYVIYNYLGNNEQSDKDTIDLLIEYAESNNVLDQFISDDNVKYHAQAKLIEDGVNLRISVANDMQYSALNSLIAWQNENKLKGDESVNDVFNIVRGRYAIDEKLTKYEARAVLGVLNAINQQGYLAYQPINIAYGIKDVTVARIAEELSTVSGIEVSVEPVRYYPEGNSAAHILGYIGKISQPNEIEKYVRQRKYSPGQLIGKTGIEESYELSLAGTSGVKKVEVDVVGNTTSTLADIKPIPGDNVYLSIDLKLQQEAERALAYTLEELSKGGTYKSQWGDYKFGIHNRLKRPYKNANSGAIVAIDVKTGETLAMASYPAYDPGLFATGISNSDWLSLFPEDMEDQLAPRPLYNIATQTSMQPGSTFKMVTALAALEKGLNPYLKITDYGYVTIGNKRFNCLIYTLTGGTHGRENLVEALRDSCNYYFYTLALGRNQRTNQSIGVKVEIEDIAQMSKKLGLNDKTGIEINIPSEVSGGVPDPQRKIITTKYLLKNMLNSNIKSYVNPELELEDSDFEQIVEDIISWTEYEIPLSRAEVVRRLTAHGIDAERKLQGEREGLADKIKYTYLNQAGWNISDTLNVTIGQGQNAYTTIQMANYIATISNGGYLNKVTLIDSVRNYDNTALLYKHNPTSDRILLNDYNNLEHIKKGMQMVADDGTARRIFGNFPVKVGVKTGTAERSGINPTTKEPYDDFAWFVGFAPYEDPEIAIATVIFQGGSGGFAAPMVRDVIAEYLGLNKVELENPLPFENSFVND